jgi:hypothetical protein
VTERRSLEKPRHIAAPSIPAADGEITCRIQAIITPRGRQRACRGSKSRSCIGDRKATTSKRSPSICRRCPHSRLSADSLRRQTHLYFGSRSCRWVGCRGFRRHARLPRHGTPLAPYSLHRTHSIRQTPKGANTAARNRRCNFKMISFRCCCDAAPVRACREIGARRHTRQRAAQRPRSDDQAVTSGSMRSRRCAETRVAASPRPLVLSLRSTPVFGTRRGSAARIAISTNSPARSISFTMSPCRCCCSVGPSWRRHLDWRRKRDFHQGACWFRRQPISYDDECNSSAYFAL